MNAEQAKIQNVIDMAFGFSAMTRVFEKQSTEKIINKLNEVLSQIAYLKNKREFTDFHDDFCRWFEQNIKTAKREKKNGRINSSGPASYGQGAKVLDVALKVYVYYCHLPDPETAERTTRWLNAAIDTKMMGYLKKYPEAVSIKATAIADVDEKTYAVLQKLVRKDIQDNKHKFLSGTLLVQWDDIMWRYLNKK
ncbi:MAG: hypothetical protein PHU08_07375 [Dehalococcoidales bacterium]|nr:hypothetical protein [Dehalococcoidales bacterium]